MIVRFLLPLLMLAGCSDSQTPPERNDGTIELPEPSGPPVVQQVENRSAPAAPAEPAKRQ
jgi:hypothetical protein